MKQQCVFLVSDVVFVLSLSLMRKLTKRQYCVYMLWMRRGWMCPVSPVGNQYIRSHGPAITNYHYRICIFVLWYAGAAVPQVLQYLWEVEAPAMQSCKPLPCGTGSWQNRRLISISLAISTVILLLPMEKSYRTSSQGIYIIKTKVIVLGFYLLI